MSRFGKRPTVRTLTSWLVVQPNIQYVINPGADAQIKDATVLGVRFELSAEK